MLFAAWNVSAQEYYFSESFVTGHTPNGWEVKDVSYSSSSSNAANQVDPTAEYAAKMKTNNTDAWIMFPKVNGVTNLAFWCKVKDPTQNPVVKIQRSTNGVLNPTRPVNSKITYSTTLNRKVKALLLQTPSLSIREKYLMM